MPAEAEKPKSRTANGTNTEHMRCLSNIGAVHDPSAADPRLYTNDMYRELNRLHINAMNEQASGPQRNPISRSDTGGGNVNPQLPGQLKQTRSSSGPTQHSQQAHVAPAFETDSIRRWQGESAYDQPWNRFRHGDGEGSDKRA